jgi:hypothetical protein
LTSVVQKRFDFDDGGESIVIHLLL